MANKYRTPRKTHAAREFRAWRRWRAAFIRKVYRGGRIHVHADIALRLAFDAMRAERHALQLAA